MIELQNLCKQFTQKNGQLVKAVDNVSLKVAEGEICVLLGPSGCGKTTTMKMINRLIEPTSGKVLIAGEDTAGIDTVTLRRHIGYVIQQIGLFPNMTIEENIMVVPRMLGWDKKRCRERARELMRMVALDPDRFLQRYPREMSGGQQQRIGVIRALAADAPVLLMDEPFGAVDPINREQIQNEFLQMQRQLGKTVMLVSHDIDEAIKLGDRVAVFRQGRMVQCAGADEMLARPADDFVASFVGHDRTLKRLLLVQAGEVADLQDTLTATLDTPLSAAYGMMDDGDLMHLTVVDAAGQPLGFVRRRDAKAGGGSCRDKLNRIEVMAGAGENLRVVLSRLYEHNLTWMPVVDEAGRYCGEVSQDYIAGYLHSGRTRR
ncbi:ABC transporter ATP-binding protein, partial [Chromobacterium piscinae]